MKSLLTRIMAVLTVLLLVTGTVAFADISNEETALSVDTTFDQLNNELSVHGHIDSPKGYIPMVLIMTRDGKTEHIEQIVTDKATDSGVDFEFSKIPFLATTPSGDYEIYVSAAYLDLSYTDIYTHMGADAQWELINDVNTAIKNNNPLEVMSAFADNCRVLGKEREYFESLSEKAREKFGKLIISKGLYDIPEEGSTPGEYMNTTQKVEKIVDTFKKLIGDYEYSYVIASAVNASGKALLEDFLVQYKDALGLYNDSDSTPYDESKMAAFFKDAMEFDSLYPHIISASYESDTHEELKDGMLRAGILAYIENARYDMIMEAVNALPGLLDVDKSNYSLYSKQQIAEIYQSLADKKYSSIESFVSAHNALLPAVNNGESSGGGSSGGSSGGGSFGGSSGGSKVTYENTPTYDTKIAFVDTEDVKWAHTAITALAEKGIISGRGNGIFAPNDNITRAEFAKIIVEAFGVNKTEYKGTFDDVSPDDWFAPYVASAQASGIVMGNGGSFAPYSLITREDMAVMLFRAMKLTKSSNEKEVFFDSADISDYAVSAVYALYEKGIVKGSGNGMFVPKSNATRAEAAQMIYNSITER